MCKSGSIKYPDFHTSFRAIRLSNPLSRHCCGFCLARNTLAVAVKIVDNCTQIDAFLFFFAPIVFCFDFKGLKAQFAAGVCST
jgi:hypothetical protein